MANLSTILKRDTAGRVATDGIADAAVTTAKLADAAVTTAKLASNAAIPVGAIMPFAQNAVPSGWLAANGAQLSKITYATLLAAIGTTYGDTTTHFQIPDLRGIFIRGFGSQVISGVTYSGSSTFGGDQGAYAGYNDFKAYIDDGDSGTGAYGSYSQLEINKVQTQGGYGGAESSWTPTISVPTNPGDTRPANITLLYCIKF